MFLNICDAVIYSPAQFPYGMGSNSYDITEVKIAKRSGLALNLNLNLNQSRSWHAIELMETSSRARVPMPSISHSSCPPPNRGNQSTLKHRRLLAHHQRHSTLFPRPSHHRGQAQVDAMGIVDAGAQLRALLHQSAESWTRRHRIEIR